MADATVTISGSEVQVVTPLRLCSEPSSPRASEQAVAGISPGAAGSRSIHGGYAGGILRADQSIGVESHVEGANEQKYHPGHEKGRF